VIVTPKHVEQLSDEINSVTCGSCGDLYSRIVELVKCCTIRCVPIKHIVICHELEGLGTRSYILLLPVTTFRDGFRGRQ
jgi:hypothetical protein